MILAPGPALRQSVAFDGIGVVFLPPMADQTLYQSPALRVVLRAGSVAMIAEGPHVCLSHAPYRGAMRAARSVVIHETRNDELSLDVDPIALLATRMAAIDPHGVGMLTSRRVAAAMVNESQADNVQRDIDGHESSIRSHSSPPPPVRITSHPRFLPSEARRS